MGYGDITPKGMTEYIYTIVVMLMGVSFYAYIASNVAIVLANMDEVGSEYRDNMEKLSEFMTRKRMTLPVVGEILDSCLGVPATLAAILAESGEPLRPGLPRLVLAAEEFEAAPLEALSALFESRFQGAEIG